MKWTQINEYLEEWWKSKCKYAKEQALSLLFFLQQTFSSFTRKNTTGRHSERNCCWAIPCVFFKNVFCCKESDCNTHAKARTEFLNDFCLETISMTVTAQINLECTSVNLMYVWEGQKRHCNCDVSGALVICNMLVRKPVLHPARKIHLFQQ